MNTPYPGHDDPELPQINHSTVVDGPRKLRRKYARQQAAADRRGERGDAPVLGGNYGRGAFKGISR